MDFWSRYSRLIVVGTEIFTNPLFSLLIEDVGESLSIEYVSTIEKLKEKLSNRGNNTDNTLPEAVILPDFISTREFRSLPITKVCIYGLPSLYALRFSGRNWTKPKPVFSFAMADAVVTLTGFRDHDYVVSSKFSIFIRFIESSRCIYKLDGW